MVELVPVGEEIGYQLITIRKVIDQLELKFSKLAAEFVKTDFWEDQGSASPYDWVRFNCHMTSNAAGDRVAVGELRSEERRVGKECRARWTAWRRKKRVKRV